MKQFDSEPIISVGLLGASTDGWVKNADGTTTIPNVKIGIGFHWERHESQTFAGEMTVEEDGLVINHVPLEEYLRSVISSEMKADAPGEFLKAHAIVSRSWLLAMLNRPHAEGGGKHEIVDITPGGHRRIIRWYDRDDHDRFDVCADDHCQRYQGIGRISNPAVDEAIRLTRGLVLTCDGEICDARFSKCCGGRTEAFPTAWEDKEVPYLQPIDDVDENGNPYCNCHDKSLLQSIMNGYDLETTSFFDWEETVTAIDIQEYFRTKGGIDIGGVIELTPSRCGQGGRIQELLVKGTDGEIIIGKELEIRRLLSETHLQSSLFNIHPIKAERGIPGAFHLKGRGWGHGVGMCQIGAAVMASRGKSCEDILHHYFTNVKINRLYD